MARRCRIGILAEPDSPQTIAGWLSDRLPDTLSGDREWTVDVEVDPVAAGQRHVGDILQTLVEHTARHEWDYAICLTDLPLRHDQRPVLAEIDHDQGVAVMALPALGGIQPARRARQLITQILNELTTSAEVEHQPGASRRGLHSRPTRLLAPIQRHDTSTEPGHADVRYLTTRRRGRIRLLTGMVRTNRPWRLTFGLSRALAAAVAASVFGLSSSTIWQIAYAVGPWRGALAAVVSVVVLVAWLITAHNLWETSTATTVHDRAQARLYNLSTVATLTLGVACLYAGLFAINLAIAALLVPLPLITSTIGSTAANPTTYIALAWGFTTMGMIAGALGSSLESDQAVRQAAYGYREQQRRAQNHTTDPTPTRGHPETATAQAPEQQQARPTRPPPGQHQPLGHVHLADDQSLAGNTTDNLPAREGHQPAPWQTDHHH